MAISRASALFVAFLALVLACSATVVVNFRVLSVPTLESPTVIADRTITKFATVKTLPGVNWPIQNLSVGTTNVTQPSGSVIPLESLGYGGSATIFPGLTVYWKPVKSGDEYVDMALRGIGNGGWIGVGFPAGGNFAMIGSDAVIGWVDGSGNATVGAYYLAAKQESQIQPNAALEISAVSGEQSGSITTIMFRRKLNSGRNPISDISKTAMIGASSSQDYIVYHDVHSDSLVTANLMTGAVTNSPVSLDSMKVAHGILNWIAWGFIFPVAIIIARYGKKLGKEGTWFEIHRGLQVVGFVLTTIAFILAFIMTGGAHFTTRFHAQLGVILYIFVVAQIVYGIFRPHKEKGQPLTVPRKIFEIVHPWTGRIITIASVAQIFEGFLHLTGSYRRGMGYFVVEGIVVVVLIVTVVVLEIRLRCCNKDDQDSKFHKMSAKA